MKNLIITFVLSFSSLVHAQSIEQMFNKNVKVTREEGKVFLVGSDCNVLNNEGKALSEWTKSVKEDVRDTSCRCKKNVCKKEVSSMLPDFAESYQFKHMPTDGPNCWNATLVAAKIVPQLRYTSDMEMNFWMHSPLCRERKPNEASAPGDIIAIRDWEQGEVHGFVHLSDNLSFSKNGFSKESPYSIQDPNVVFDIYEVPKNCRRKTGKDRSCKVYANYYTCKSMEDYLKEKPLRDKEARKALIDLDELECQISVAVISGSNGQTLKTLVAASLQAIHTLAYNTLKDNKFKEEDKVVWQALFHKSKSLADQVLIMQ